MTVRFLASKELAKCSHKVGRKKSTYTAPTGNSVKAEPESLASVYRSFLSSDWLSNFHSGFNSKHVLNLTSFSKSK
ncbi:hypothetical protein VNO77_29793 [Canavalia gladiata]|uniref:Uncharacterized protein n=1 Tax=Canavalia gladiata TaxID=3824 RepID=A0AAN9Q2W7_CANGL